MEDIQIDWLVILIAAVLNMVMGFLWYSKWLFGPLRERFESHSHKEMTGKIYVFGFLISLVIAFFLSFFEAYLGVTTVSDGMFVGFLFWLGFVFTTQISSVIWGKHPVQLFLIDTGFKLFSFLVMSGLIGA